MNRKTSFFNADFGFLVFVSALFIFFSNQTLDIKGQTSGKKSRQVQRFDESILSEEYEVYSSFIKSEIGNSSIVIDERTSIPTGLDFLKDPNESGFEDSDKNYQADEDAFKNLKEAGGYNFTLENKFSVKNKILFFTEKQKENIDRQTYESGDDMKAHELFEKEFGRPTAYTFSRVGFNKDKTTALFVLSTWCGKLCGEISFISLEKENQNWIIKRKNTKAVS